LEKESVRDAKREQKEGYINASICKKITRKLLGEKYIEERMKT